MRNAFNVSHIKTVNINIHIHTMSNEADSFWTSFLALEILGNLATPTLTFMHIVFSFTCLLVAVNNKVLLLCTRIKYLIYEIYYLLYINIFIYEISIT